MNDKQHINWNLTIKPTSNVFDLKIKQIFRYKDLLFLFVKRDFISVYKQTVLGPAWFFIQPILTAFTFSIIFGNIAKISTDGLPQILFYLSGITLWNYFSETLLKTSDTFTANANLFGKVYFPRLIVPLSIVFSNLAKMGVQLLLFILIWSYYLIFEQTKIQPNFYIALFPFLILLMGLLGLSLGIIITSMTTKYRDLRFLIQFAVQLLMYASPIVYPLSIVPDKFKTLMLLNPITSIIETFKYGFLGSGEFSWYNLLYSTIIIFVLFVFGVLIFNRVEKSFVDTV
jgi:lipopolysaccharide transport system permease protein